MTTPLPGEWVEFGRDVVRVAAHPSRPWLALVRQRANCVEVEQYDLQARATREVTEVPTGWHELIWVGDRVALIVLRQTVEADYIDVGSGGVDVVYLHDAYAISQSETPREADPWGLDVFPRREKHRKLTGVRLVPGRAGTTLLALESPSLIHPDGMRRVLIDFPRSANEIELIEGNARRRVEIPRTISDTFSVPIGWSSPDRFVLVTDYPLERSAGPCELWSVGWEAMDVVSLNAHIDPLSGCYATELSPDGAHLAVWHDVSPRENFWLSVIDAHTGALVAQAASPDMTPPLRWMGPCSLVNVVYTEIDFDLAVFSLRTHSMREYTLTLKRGVDGPWLNELFPHRVSGDRLLVFAPRFPWRCFLSEPVLSL